MNIIKILECRKCGTRITSEFIIHTCKKCGCEDFKLIQNIFERGNGELRYGEIFK